MTSQLSVHYRVQVIERLDELASELTQISGWLAGLGIDGPSLLCQDAARDVFASCWLLERPIDRRVPGGLASTLRSAVGGYRGG